MAVIEKPQFIRIADRIASEFNRMAEFAAGTGRGQITQATGKIGEIQYGVFSYTEGLSRFTLQRKGLETGKVSFEILNTGSNNQSLWLYQQGNAFKVYPATDSGGIIKTTVRQLVDFLKDQSGFVSVFDLKSTYIHPGELAATIAYTELVSTDGSTLSLRSKKPGPAGNEYSLRLLNRGVATTLAVNYVIEEKTLEVVLGVSGGLTVTTTPDLLKAAIEANIEAAARFEVILPVGTQAVLKAQDRTFFSGGLDGSYTEVLCEEPSSDVNNNYARADADVVKMVPVSEIADRTIISQSLLTSITYPGPLLNELISHLRNVVGKTLAEYLTDQDVRVKAGFSEVYKNRLGVHMESRLVFDKDSRSMGTLSLVGSGPYTMTLVGGVEMNVSGSLYAVGNSAAAQPQISYEIPSVAAFLAVAGATVAADYQVSFKKNGVKGNSSTWEVVIPNTVTATPSMVITYDADGDMAFVLTTASTNGTTSNTTALQLKAFIEADANLNRLLVITIPAVGDGLIGVKAVTSFAGGTNPAHLTQPIEFSLTGLGPNRAVQTIRKVRIPITGWAGKKVPVKDLAFATITAGTGGTPAQITVEAKEGGSSGNLISIELSAPAGLASQPLTVTRSGRALIVGLATNGSAVITSTVQNVVDALTASVEASELVVASVVGTGSQVSQRVSKTFLLGGLEEPKFTQITGATWISGGVPGTILRLSSVVERQ